MAVDTDSDTRLEKQGRDVTRRLSAVVCMDVQGYSRLMADDDVDTVRSIKACRSLVTRSIQDHRGRVVDSPGDSLLAEFFSAADAVQCAADMQSALKEQNRSVSESRRMEFRIGVHLGDVIADGDQIFGSGVNIAARLESTAPGGGICISGVAFDQVRNVLPLGFEYLGRRRFKNIPDPIPVYRVLTDPADKGRLVYAHKKHDPAFRKRKNLLIGFLILCIPVAGLILRLNGGNRPPQPPVKGILRERLLQMRLPDKPSIAVLPFLNLSEDSDQDYFSDGLTEDLITDLSRVSGLFVIARNSSFAYKDRSVSVDRIGRDLGVRYVLEGSVRKMDDRVRITAQLVDTLTEGHVWAERYDRNLADLFAVQDEVRDRIVLALSVQLTSDDRRRLEKKTTVDLPAYDYYLRGLELQALRSPESLSRSRRMFEKAIGLDPIFARARAALGNTVLMEWIFGYSSDPETLETARELAVSAIEVDPEESSGHALLSSVYLWTRKHDQALAAIRKAMTLDPHRAEWMAMLGEQLAWAGDLREGIPYILSAIRLDPEYPEWFVWNLGHAYYLTKDYEAALEAFEQALARNPDFWPTHVYLALCYDALGLSEKGAAEIEILKGLAEKILEIPWEDRLPYKDPGTGKHIHERLKAMGLGY